MRKPILIAVTTFGLAAAGLGVGVGLPLLQAQAQQAPADAPPPPGPGPGSAPDGHGGMRPWGMGPMGWMHHHQDMHGMWHPDMHGMWHHMDTFALLHRPADRALSGADVQKIAEGFLLWNGNHSWKITGVTEQDESTVGFNVATASGDVIARFTMNRHTGQVSRVS
jgi:hypothetical protein